VSRTAKPVTGMSEGQFVATVAHELKAPLHTIETIARSASGGMWGKPTAALRQQLTRIELGAHRMLELSDSLLRLEQVRSGRLEPLLMSLQPQTLVEDALSVVQPYLDERKQTLSYSQGKITLPILADPLYTRHALLNILLNATKYSPVGSSLSIRARQHQQVVCIEVRDQASALGTHARSQLSSPRPVPSYQRDASGYGMGLFIASRFVNSSGGEVEYHQIRSGGNCFVLRLPVVRQLTLFSDEEAT
jgi:signal transduction histidine kinase